MFEHSFVLVSFEKQHDFSIKGKIQIDADDLKCQLSVIGDLSKLKIPQKTEVKKTEGLWNSTCFEIFVKSGKEYIEWNFSPSGEWWVMKFSDYRKRMDAESVFPKNVEWKQSQSLSCLFEIPIPFPLKSRENLQIGISCVLETQNQKTHWALKHSSKLDFHRSENFISVNAFS